MKHTKLRRCTSVASAGIASHPPKYLPLFKYGLRFSQSHCRNLQVADHAGGWLWRGRPSCDISMISECAMQAREIANRMGFYRDLRAGLAHCLLAATSMGGGKHVLPYRTRIFSRYPVISPRLGVTEGWALGGVLPNFFNIRTPWRQDTC